MSLNKGTADLIQASLNREGSQSSTVITHLCQEGGKASLLMLPHEQIHPWLALKPHSQDSAGTPGCSVSPLLQGHSRLAGLAPEEHVPGAQQDLSEHFRSSTRPKSNQEVLSSQQAHRTSESRMGFQLLPSWTQGLGERSQTAHRNTSSWGVKGFFKDPQYVQLASSIQTFLTFSLTCLGKQGM